MRLRLLPALLVCAAIGLGGPKAAAASVHHVDRDSLGGRCSDAYSAAQAQDPATPWCTIPHAVAAVAPGSVVSVRAGVYPEFVLSDSTRSEIVTVRAHTGEQPQMPGLRVTRCTGLRFEGFRFTGKVVVGADSRGIQIVGNHIENLAEFTLGVGIAMGSSDILVERNYIRVPYGNGLNLSSDYQKPPIENVVVRGNRFDTIGIDAMQIKNYRNLLIEGNDISGVRRFISDGHSDVIQSVYGGVGLTIRNNFIHDNAAGILLKDGRVDDVLIENNLIVRTTEAHVFDISNAEASIVGNTIHKSGFGVAIHHDQAGIPGTSSITLLNNILPNVKLDGAAAIARQDHNLVAYAPHVRGPNDIGGTATFADADAGDFQLAAGSLGIDAGTSDGGVPGVDRLGHGRLDDPAVDDHGTGAVRYFDIGAFERQGATEPPPPGEEPPPGDEEPPQPAPDQPEPSPDTPAPAPREPGQPVPPTGGSDRPKGEPALKVRVKLERRRGRLHRVSVTCSGPCGVAVAIPGGRSGGRVARVLLAGGVTRVGVPRRPRSGRVTVWTVDQHGNATRFTRRF